MPLKGKYLKYSPEITLEIFTLVWDKLIENGCKFEYSKEIIFERFKFHYRVLRYDSNGNYVYPLPGNNSCKETTVQEILGYDPFVKNDFVLPDKWCIKHTNNKELHEFFENYNHGGYSGSSNNFFHYPRFNGANCLSLEIKSGYIEITFDQFKKYVLKKSVEEPKEVIPEYVELLKGFDNTNTGKIFNTTQKIPEMKGWSNIWTWESIFKNDIQQKYFKPSTKEAFDAQNKPIEKWSVGSYVVFLKDNLQANFRKRGDISEITHVNVNTDNITFGDGICNNIDGEFSVVTNLKWFATKSEAEEFAKTLVEPVKQSLIKVFPIEGYCEKNSDIIQYLSKSKTIYESSIGKENDNKFKFICWNEAYYWFTCDKSSKQYYSFTVILGLIQKEKQLKQAVNCTTQEEWDFVTEKLGNDGTNWFKHPDWGNNKSFCISFEGKNQSQTLDFYINAGYQILSFQEWCDLNGYKMEKEVKFEVGKWYKAYYAEKIYFLKYKNTIPRNGYNQINCSEFINNGAYKANDSISNTDLENSFKVLDDLSEIQQYLPDNHPDKIKNDIKFKVGDWVFAVGNILEYSQPTIGKIDKFSIGNEYDSRVNFYNKSGSYCTIWSNVIRHATPEEIYNYSVSIGQIPAEKYPFKKLKEDDLTWEIKVPNSYHGIVFYSEPVPITKDNWKHEMLLSINDEEFPMVNIIKTNIIKQLLNND